MSSYSFQVTISGDSGSMAIVSCDGQKEVALPLSISLSDLIKNVTVSTCTDSSQGQKRRRETKSVDPQRQRGQWMRGQRWTSTQEAFMIQLLKEGTEVDAIAERLGRSTLAITLRFAKVFSRLIEDDKWTPERIQSEFKISSDVYAQWMKPWEPALQVQKPPIYFCTSSGTDVCGCVPQHPMNGTVPVQKAD